MIEKKKGVFIWKEAEEFDSLGGWDLDSQFFESLGTAYLIANGMGTPVKDAETILKIPKEGTYRLWVRCKNWVPEVRIGKWVGKFKVSVGNNVSETTFGEFPEYKWLWEDGGKFTLSEGEISVSLQDLTGWYGRCDAILLTDDLSFDPPNEREEIEKFKNYIGYSKRPKEIRKKYDVVVIGGGLAGLCASISASREGCSVALIQDRPVLGGNASEEIRVRVAGHAFKVPDMPPPVHFPNLREPGIVEEFKLEIANDIQDFEHGWPNDIIMKVVQKEKNIDIFDNNVALFPHMIANKIESVVTINPRTGERLIILGDIFLDSSGDGVIAYRAGANYRMGIEGKKEFNESLGPVKPYKYVLGSTIKYDSKDTGKPQTFTRPPWARPFEHSDIKSNRPRIRDIPADFTIEYGGVLDTIYDAEEIRDELFRITFGYWDLVKRSDLKAKNHVMDFLPIVVGKRESRRFIGDYILNQNDVQNAPLFSDRVAFGGWPIDPHPYEGIYGSFFGKASTGEDNNTFLSGIYSIPYRCLYSNNIENLLFAGRNISATHFAFCSARVMATCGLEGQAVGIAASLCKKYKTTPRGIYQNYIGEMQQKLLKEGCYLINISNEDEGDLAKTAKILVSSGEDTANNVINGITLNGNENMWISEDKTPQWIELDFGCEKEFNSVRIIFDTNMDPAYPNTPRSEKTVKDYKLLYFDKTKSSWVDILKVEDNYQRLRVHDFETIKSQKIRVQIDEINVISEGKARLYEIRVYKENSKKY